MSKKQILKNMEKNSKKNISSSEKDTFFKFITTLVILILVMILVYFLIGVFYTKEIDFKSDDEEETEEVSVDNSTITLGQLFEQSDDEYYVVVYDVNEENSVVATWLSIFKSNNSDASVYTVDSKNKLNSRYLTEDESNNAPSSYSDLKVKSPTLIKVKDKKVSEYIEGEDSIKDYLKNN